MVRALIEMRVIGQSRAPARQSAIDGLGFRHDAAAGSWQTAETPDTRQKEHPDSDLRQANQNRQIGANASAW